MTLVLYAVFAVLVARALWQMWRTWTVNACLRSGHRWTDTEDGSGWTCQRCGHEMHLGDYM